MKPRYGLSGKTIEVSKHFFQSSEFLVCNSTRSLDLDFTYVKRPFVGDDIRLNCSYCSVKPFPLLKCSKGTYGAASKLMRLVIMVVVVLGLAVSRHGRYTWPGIGVLGVGIADD